MISRYCFKQFENGYKSSGAWCGWYTIQTIFNRFCDQKPGGCSWRAWGFICGTYFYKPNLNEYENN